MIIVQKLIYVRKHQLYSRWSENTDWHRLWIQIHFSIKTTLDFCSNIQIQYYKFTSENSLQLSNTHSISSISMASCHNNLNSDLNLNRISESDVKQEIQFSCSGRIPELHRSLLSRSVTFCDSLRNEGMFCKEVQNPEILFNVNLQSSKVKRIRSPSLPTLIECTYILFWPRMYSF